jgi:hypothetical protein
MSQQYNKVIKRRRRLAYKKRKAQAARAARSAKTSKKDKS